MCSSPAAVVVSALRPSYRVMPLCNLVDRVCLQGDRGALEEVHERPLFQTNGTGRVRLVEFVDHLRAVAASKNHVAADHAYDITIDRFSRLPEGCCGGPRKAVGTDCRRYLEAFRKVIHARRAEGPGFSSIADEECFAAALLQRSVMKHFRLAQKEAYRGAMMTRYVWTMPDGQITALLPRTMVGGERRKWLERNVPDCDPKRVGEQDRVQAIINEKLGRNGGMVVAEEDAAAMVDHRTHDGHLPWGMRIPYAAEGLAETVAAEKAATWEELRPGIQRLRPDGVYHLVHRIFGDLTDGQYHLAEVARAFGLPKATLCRFAAVQWHQNGDRIESIPDLWANTARVIGQNPDFVDVAQESGVWPSIRVVLSVVHRKRGEP